jgi:transcription-repair coupling factor (superfamily II helicase)
MKLVAKNAKRGAQFTPQGLLRYPLGSPKPDDVLAEVRALLDQLALREAAVQ